MCQGKTAGETACCALTTDEDKTQHIAYVKRTTATLCVFTKTLSNSTTGNYWGYFEVTIGYERKYITQIQITKKNEKTGGAQSGANLISMNLPVRTEEGENSRPE